MGSFGPAMAMTALQYGLDTAQQDAQKAASKAEMRARTAQINQAQSSEAADRREQLRRAVASQRARFGAQGLATSESAAAALRGFEKETESAIAESRAAADFQIQRLADQRDMGRRANLLSASNPRNRAAFSVIQRGLQTGTLLRG